MECTLYIAIYNTLYTCIVDKKWEDQTISLGWKLKTSFWSNSRFIGKFLKLTFVKGCLQMYRHVIEFYEKMIVATAYVSQIVRHGGKATTRADNANPQESGLPFNPRQSRITRYLQPIWIHVAKEQRKTKWALYSNISVSDLSEKKKTFKSVPRCPFCFQFASLVERDKVSQDLPEIKLL